MTHRWIADGWSLCTYLTLLYWSWITAYIILQSSLFCWWSHCVYIIHILYWCWVPSCIILQSWTHYSTGGVTVNINYLLSIDSELQSVICPGAAISIMLEKLLCTDMTWFILYWFWVTACIILQSWTHYSAGRETPLLMDIIYKTGFNCGLLL